MNTPGIRDEETRKISGWEEKILGDSVRTLVPAQCSTPIRMVQTLKAIVGNLVNVIFIVYDALHQMQDTVVDTHRELKHLRIM